MWGNEYILTNKIKPMDKETRIKIPNLLHKKYIKYGKWKAGRSNISETDNKKIIPKNTFRDSDTKSNLWNLVSLV